MLQPIAAVIRTRAIWLMLGELQSPSLVEHTNVDKSTSVWTDVETYRHRHLDFFRLMQGSLQTSRSGDDTVAAIVQCDICATLENCTPEAPYFAFVVTPHPHPLFPHKTNTAVVLRTPMRALPLQIPYGVQERWWSLVRPTNLKN